MNARKRLPNPGRFFRWVVGVRVDGQWDYFAAVPSRVKPKRDDAIRLIKRMSGRKGEAWTAYPVTPKL